MSRNQGRDRIIYCSDCGDNFVFSAGEQRHYQNQGFQDPKRCSDCRRSRKKAGRNKAHWNSRSSHSSSLPDDIELECIDCGTMFDFAGSQQLFFERKGFTPPRRCQDCNEGRKSYKQAMKQLENKYLDSSGELPLNKFNAYYHERNEVLKREQPDLICGFCSNRGHKEGTCHLKKSATCNKCGKIGYATSAGMASGYRNNTFRLACDCD